VGSHAAQVDGQKARKQVIWQQFGGLMQQFGWLTRKRGYRAEPFGDAIA
jgi:hypothetical protein